MKSLIQKLVESSGPSGYEKEVRDIVWNEVQSFVDDGRIDPLGNLILRKGQKNRPGKRIILAAHMDEIGVMASFIDENGFIRFTNIGGVYPINCVGSRVRFLNGISGVIGMDKLEKPGVPELSQLYIDVGASSRK
jgi:endoglucanase